MTKPNANPPLLTERNARFICSEVSINVAGRNARNFPSVARAFGCRVSADRKQVTVFLPIARAESVLRDIREIGAIAVVFTKPSTHESIQLKGGDAKIVALQSGDRAIMQEYGRIFVCDINSIGYRDPFASAMMSAVAEESVAVVFTPDAAFEQTPGPGAGKRLTP